MSVPGLSRLGTLDRNVDQNDRIECVERSVNVYNRKRALCIRREGGKLQQQSQC